MIEKVIVESVYKMGVGVSFPLVQHPRDHNEYSIVEGYMYIQGIAYEFKVIVSSLDPKIIADRIYEKGQTIIDGLNDFKGLSNAITIELQNGTTQN